MHKAVVVLIAVAWLAVVALTHWGSRSPYSYGWAMFPGDDLNAIHLQGATANPDALPIHDVMLYFYDGRYVDWGAAQNLALPLHAFSVATVAGITRSTLLSNYLTNLLFLTIVTIAAVNLADRYGIRRGATLLTLLTLWSLPIVLDYVGQPLHYVVGICASFLVVMSLLAIDDLKPWIAALAVAILLLNYDPYIFIAATVTWLVFVRRFERRWHVVVFLVLAPLPKIAWTQFLRWASHDNMTTHLRDTFIRPVIAGWKEMLADPLGNAMQPFVASHIGVHVALHQIVAMIYWPLVAACVWLLFRLRPRLDRRFMLLALMPAFLFLEQMAAAAWDWELNPRRAIPVVLAFAVAWCWSLDHVWEQRRWRIGAIALCVMSALLAMSDTLLREPVMAFLRTGQAMRLEPQEAMRKENLQLIPYSMPKLVRDQEKITWRDLPPARVQKGDNHRTIFMVSQAMGLFLLVGLFWLTARARILPRWAPFGALGVWMVSLVRFL
ncbi:MAG TPA: hypothetical protein VNI54_00960 [Thermoanaerobaculia bacterium]|nr:hypothetical protein [Thermoanaerobaculia bacterium]